MQPTFRRIPLFFLVLSLLVVAGGPTVTAQPPAPTYVYTVKYLCSKLHPFPTIFHWTDINILNPSKGEPAVVHKKFIVSGTQENPTFVEPVRDRFELGPNQAASITCDEIQRMFGVPLSTSMEGFVEIESNQKLTVVGIYDKCVPGQRIDVFQTSRLTTDLELTGIGRFSGLTLDGPAVVQKAEMRLDPEHGRFLQPTEMVSMELEGRLEMGEREIPIRLIESPRFQSEGRIVGELDPVTMSPLFPARSSFDVFFEIVSDDAEFQERFGRLYNLEAARVQAIITGIPPGLFSKVLPQDQDRERLLRVVPEARLHETRGGTEVQIEHATLGKMDDPINEYCDPGPTRIFSARSPGNPVGQVSNHCHAPNPPTPLPPVHAEVHCDNASIDVEYIEPMTRPRRPGAPGKRRPRRPR